MSSIFAIIAFIVGGGCVFFSYRQGLRDGQSVKAGEKVEKIVVQKVKPQKLTDEEKKRTESLNRDFMNMMNYKNE